MRLGAGPLADRPISTGPVVKGRPTAVEAKPKGSVLVDST